MSQQQGMSLKRRLQWQVILVTILLVLVGGITLYFERQTLIQDRQDKVRNLTESAMTVLKGFEDLAAAGKLSEADAKAQAAAVLNTMRYDVNEYFFAFDTQWTWVAHGVKPQLTGKNLFDIKDPTGVNLGELFRRETQASGKGFAQYVWDKPGFDTPQPKLSYLETTPRWKWVVGTGIS